MLEKTANWEKPIDIFAIGFEEIVDLNASNIMKARYLSSLELSESITKFNVNATLLQINKFSSSIIACLLKNLIISIK
jgi:hypothetical protein